MPIAALSKSKKATTVLKSLKKRKIEIRLVPGEKKKVSSKLKKQSDHDECVESNQDYDGTSSSKDDASVQDDKSFSRLASRKVPLNVASVSLDEISFHSKERVGCWKYGVKRRIVAKKELSDHAQCCVETVELIQRASLLKIVLNVGLLYPLVAEEILVLFGCFLKKVVVFICGHPSRLGWLLLFNIDCCSVVLEEKSACS